MKTTKAEFLRWLVPGKTVRLVDSLMGPCDKPRTVLKVSGMEAQFCTEKDTVSYLRITPEEHVERTANGYRIVFTQDGRTCAEYVEGVVGRDWNAAQEVR